MKIIKHMNIFHNKKIERKIGPKFGDKDHNKLDNQFMPKLYEDQIKNHKGSLVSYKDETLLINKNKLLEIDYQIIILREI